MAVSADRKAPTLPVSTPQATVERLLCRQAGDHHLIALCTSENMFACSLYQALHRPEAHNPQGGVGLGNNTSLNDNVQAGAAQLFVAPAMHLLEGDEQCAQPQPRRPIASIFTEQPRSEAVFLQTPLATHCASSHCELPL